MRPGASDCAGPFHLSGGDGPCARRSSWFGGGAAGKPAAGRRDRGARATRSARAATAKPLTCVAPVLFAGQRRLAECPAHRSQRPVQQLRAGLDARPPPASMAGTRIAGCASSGAPCRSFPYAALGAAFQSKRTLSFSPYPRRRFGVQRQRLCHTYLACRAGRVQVGIRAKFRHWCGQNHQYCAFAANCSQNLNKLPETRRAA